MIDIAQLGTILGLWAHPDDEAFSMAGIMAAAAQNGQKVACVTATRGEQGVRDEKRWPQSQLGNIRTKEMEQCLKILHCDDHTWLDYADGELDKVNTDEAVACIASIIERVKPTSVFTFGVDGLTGHPDHRTISYWATKAFKQANLSDARLYYVALTDDMYEAMQDIDANFNLFFNVKHPRIYSDSDLAINFELPADLLTIKSQAICAHQSQYQGWLDELGEDLFEVTQKRECFCLGAER
jgi:LmbE family N-acetylglucosaminyl deacetylase